MNFSDSSEVDGEEGREKSLEQNSDDYNNTKKDSTNIRPWIRQYWEYFHRFLGITLLALAWYNCTSGIVLQCEENEQDDKQTVMAIFWSITGAIAGLIFFVGYVIRVE
jgi:heme A synthase